MKTTPFTSVLLLLLLAIGCATQKPMRIQMSGPQASSFTAKYNFGQDRGTITTDATTNPGAMLEFPSQDGSVEITKAKPDDEVTLEIFEGNERRLRVISKPGEKGVRAIRRAGGWRQEQL